MKAVLDASALLAFLFKEPGAEIVAPLLSASAISTVNLCEVLQRALERGINADALEGVADELGVATFAFDVDDARAIAQLRSRTRQFGLSLGDRACLSLGARLGLPVYTTDRAWTELDVAIDIRPIR